MKASQGDIRGMVMMLSGSDVNWRVTQSTVTLGYSLQQHARATTLTNGIVQRT